MEGRAELEADDEVGTEMLPLLLGLAVVEVTVELVEERELDDAADELDGAADELATDELAAEPETVASTESKMASLMFMNGAD